MNFAHQHNDLTVYCMYFYRESNTYSVHSFSAVSSLFIVCELISIIAAAVGEASPISDKAATAFATT